jgi:hypothetical protein
MIACREVAEFSDAFIDDEVVAGVRAGILAHLRECDDCEAVIEQKRRLKRLVGASARILTAPASLRFRVLAGIGA